MSLVTQNVYIYPDNTIDYDPSPPQVKRNQEVCFTLKDRRDSVDVNFEMVSPFGPSIRQLNLNGDSPSTASRTETVSSDANFGPYVFTVTPAAGPSSYRMDPEPNSTGAGELDVVKDPTKDPRG